MGRIVPQSPNENEFSSTNGSTRTLSSLSVLYLYFHYPWRKSQSSPAMRPMMLGSTKKRMFSDLLRRRRLVSICKSLPSSPTRFDRACISSFFCIQLKLDPPPRRRRLTKLNEPSLVQNRRWRCWCSLVEPERGTTVCSGSVSRTKSLRHQISCTGGFAVTKLIHS